MDRSFMQKCGILAAVALCMATHLRAEPRIDFNGDGYADLAVGVPDEDDAKTTDAGAVNIIYGSESGLTEIGNMFFTQRTKGVPGNRQKGAKFGRALAAGNFDGDGFTDLAVAAPLFDQPHLRDAGYVVIFHGAPKGLSGSRANGLIWLDSMARNSNFGAALAAGDFDADGIDDIAVGAPEFWSDQQITPGSGHGAVLVWYGSRFGMEGMQFWRQGEDGLSETSEYRDQFGSALVAADFDGDGADDLAMPGNGVKVYFADSDGLPIWPKYLDEFLMPGLNQGDDSQESTASVGHALAADDFEGRGSFDLAIGIPGYDIPYKHNLLLITDAGAVAVFRNTPIVQHSDPMSETPIIQWSRSLDFFEGNYPSTIHEVFGAAERGDGFGKVFAH
jgi:hypothetical protein